MVARVLSSAAAAMLVHSVVGFVLLALHCISLADHGHFTWAVARQ